jgi:hypothetical protein
MRTQERTRAKVLPFVTDSAELRTHREHYHDFRTVCARDRVCACACVCVCVGVCVCVCVWVCV